MSKDTLTPESVRRHSSPYSPRIYIVSPRRWRLAMGSMLTKVSFAILLLFLSCHHGVSWTVNAALSTRSAAAKTGQFQATHVRIKPSRSRASCDELPENGCISNPADLQRRRLVGQSSLAALAAALGLSVDPSVSNAALDSSEKQRIEVFEKAAPSVVYIDTFTERRDVFTTNVMDVPLGTGSGFVWDKEGHIVTNFHVVRDAKTAQVAILTAKSSTSASPLGRLTATSAPPAQPAQPPAQPRNPFDISPAGDILPYTSMRPSQATSRSVYKARVVGVDPSKDIAVLKVDAPKSELSPIAVGTSTGLRVGQSALAIGNPFGLDHTLTAGIISGIGREVRSPTGRPITNVIQSDAAINPGNSGGPLLDGSGRLIGMNTAIYSPSGASSGIGFAIPVDTVKFIVETLIHDGQVIRPVLGISFLESKQAKALGIQSGVLVLNVPEGSPAYKAGLRGTRRTEAGLIELGDIITKVDDVVINTEADLFRSLESFKPGDAIEVTVTRVAVNSETDSMMLQTLTLTIILQSSVAVEKSLNLYQIPNQAVPVPMPQ